MLAIFPGYELLRWLWNGDYELFTWQHLLTAVLVALLFAGFARRTMRRYLSLGKPTA